jgi:hypothetical protein
MSKETFFSEIREKSETQFNCATQQAIELQFCYFINKRRCFKKETLTLGTIAYKLNHALKHSSGYRPIYYLFNLIGL